MNSIFLISFLAALLPIGAYILFLRWLDRYEREPLRHVIVVFILGATFSAGFSYVANTTVAAIGQALFTEAGSQFFLSSVVAPVVEEINKGLIVLTFALLSKEFDNLTDGLLYGAVVGLGFAFSENIMYFMRVYEESGQFAWIRNIYIRSFFSVGVHSCATALFGAGVAYARYLRGFEKLMAVMIGLTLAVMVHSFWNSLLVASELSNDNALAVLPFLGLPAIFLILFVLFQISLSRESDMIGEELKLESQLGTLPEEHVEILKSTFRRKQSGWFAHEFDREEYVNLATELAFDSHNARKVSESKKIDFEKRMAHKRDRIKNILSNEKGSVKSTVITVFVFVSFLMGFAIFGLATWKKMLLNFPAYPVAKAYLANNPQIAELIGPIKNWKDNPTGKFFYGNWGGNGYLKVRLIGSKQAAWATVNFEHDFNGTWNISTASLKIKGQKKPTTLEVPNDWYQQAKSALGQSKFKEAMQFCEKIHELAAGDDRYQYCVSEVNFARGDHQKSLDLWNEIAVRYPDYPDYRTQLGHAYYWLNDSDKSIESYSQSYKIRSNPEVATDMAHVYLVSKDFDQAFKWLEEARNNGLRSADLAYRYGAYYYSKKDLTKASDFFWIAKKTDPSYALANFGLARVSQDQKKISDAIYFFEAGLHLAPHNSYEYRLDLVRLLIDAKYYDEAIFHLIRTTIHHNNKLDPYVMLAKLYQRQARTDNSSYVLNLAMQKDEAQTKQLSEKYDFLLE